MYSLKIPVGLVEGFIAKLVVLTVCLCSHKNWEDQTAITERVVQLLRPVEESLGCFRRAEGECHFR